MLGLVACSEASVGAREPRRVLDCGPSDAAPCGASGAAAAAFKGVSWCSLKLQEAEEQQAAAPAALPATRQAPAPRSCAASGAGSSCSPSCRASATDETADAAVLRRPPPKRPSTLKRAPCRECTVPGGRARSVSIACDGDHVTGRQPSPVHEAAQNASRSRSLPGWPMAGGPPAWADGPACGSQPEAKAALKLGTTAVPAERVAVSQQQPTAVAAARAAAAPAPTALPPLPLALMQRRGGVAQGAGALDTVRALKQLQREIAQAADESGEELPAEEMVCVDLPSLRAHSGQPPPPCEDDRSACALATSRSSCPSRRCPTQRRRPPAAGYRGNGFAGALLAAAERAHHAPPGRANSSRLRAVPAALGGSAPCASGAAHVLLQSERGGASQRRAVSAAGCRQAGGSVKPLAAGWWAGDEPLFMDPLVRALPQWLQRAMLELDVGAGDGVLHAL